MDLDFNTFIQTATLALVTVVTAIVAIVRGTVEEAAKREPHATPSSRQITPIGERS